MNKSFCEQIDRESLVEEYVRGKLQGELRTQFEAHLRECERHVQAVQQEKSLRNGVIEFARSQVRATIRRNLRPKEDIRIAMLRYAAFLFVAVVVPLMLYYQFRVFQPGNESDYAVPPQTAVMDSLQKGPDRTDEKSSELGMRAAAPRPAADVAPQTEPAPPRAKISVPNMEEPPAGLAAPSMESATAVGGNLPATPASPAAEQKSLSREKAADSRTGNLAPVSAGVQKESAAEPAQIKAQVAESALKDLASTSVGEFAKKEQYSPLRSNLKHADSSRNEIGIMVDGISTSERKPFIDDQITVQQIELLQCTTHADSTAFVKVKFIINEQGSVENLQLLDTNLPNKNVEECLLEKIRHWKFTAPGHKTVVSRRINLK